MAWARTHRGVHDAEGIVSRRLLGEVSRVGLSIRTKLIEVNELSSLRLEVRAELLESSLFPYRRRMPSMVSLVFEKEERVKKTNLLLNLSIIDDESNILSSSLLIVVLSILSDVLGSLEENGFKSLVGKRAKKSALEVDRPRGKGRNEESSQEEEQRW